MNACGPLGDSGVALRPVPDGPHRSYRGKGHNLEHLRRGLAADTAVDLPPAGGRTLSPPYLRARSRRAMNPRLESLSRTARRCHLRRDRLVRSRRRALLAFGMAEHGRRGARVRSAIKERRYLARERPRGRPWALFCPQQTDASVAQAPRRRCSIAVKGARWRGSISSSAPLRSAVRPRAKHRPATSPSCASSSCRPRAACAPRTSPHVWAGDSGGMVPPAALAAPPPVETYRSLSERPPA